MAGLSFPPTWEHRAWILTVNQYVEGSPNPETISPEAYHLDYYLVNRPGNTEIQLDIFYDYRNNVALYPKFQEYFRQHQPPTLAVWGKNDLLFVPAGAEAYKRDNPQAEVKFFDAGHFALYVFQAHSILRFYSNASIHSLGKRMSRRSVQRFWRTLRNITSSKALKLILLPNVMTSFQ